MNPQVLVNTLDVIQYLEHLRRSVVDIEVRQRCIARYVVVRVRCQHEWRSQSIAWLSLHIRGLTGRGEIRSTKGYTDVRETSAAIPVRCFLEP